MLFPTEIWLQIAAYLEQNDFLSLIQVCQRFHNIFLEGLYTNIRVKLPLITMKNDSEGSEDSIEHKFSALGRPAALLFTRLETHPTLRNHVHSITIKRLLKRSRALAPIALDTLYDPNTDSKEPGYHALIGTIMGTLANLPRLHMVEIETLQMHVDWLVYLASRPTQRLVIRIKGGDLYGQVSSRHANVTAQSLSLNGRTNCRDGSSMLSVFLSSPLVKQLDIGLLDTSFLRNAFASLGGSLVPHLESLKIPYICRDDIALFRALTNLRELALVSSSQLRDMQPNDIPSGHGPTGTMKRLESISFSHAKWIPAFTAGRKIKAICVGNFFTKETYNSISSRLSKLGYHFGSEEMVTRVRWKNCQDPQAVLDYLIRNNLGVQHLTIEPARGLASIELLASCLPKIAQLSELCTFNFTPLVHVPDSQMLAWEMEQCQYLKSRIPSLVSVSFGSRITWTCDPDDENLWRHSGLGTYI